MQATDHPSPALPLYEQDELMELTGGALRPGGLPLTSQLVQFCELQPGSAVLDIGCGPGHTLHLLASRFGLLPTGVDPSEAMLAKAASVSPTAVLLQGSATALPCGDQSFDAIVCECVLCLTGDIRSSLREMYRVLRPGSPLILTDLYRKRPDMQPTGFPLRSCVGSALSLETVVDEVEQAGFTVALLRERSDLLKQLAGQIIFSHGSLEQFWQLFMGAEEARQTCCSLAASPLGYYALIAEKGRHHG